MEGQKVHICYVSYIFNLCNSLSKQGWNPPVLVFVQNKERGKELFNELKFDDLRADVIHADLSQVQVVLGKYM